MLRVTPMLFLTHLSFLRRIGFSPCRGGDNEGRDSGDRARSSRKSRNGMDNHNKADGDGAGSKEEQPPAKKEEEEEEEDLGPPPEKPLPGDCCGSGCERCVWDIYFDELEDYKLRKAVKSKD
ncbi:uncharacterized protein LOC112341972 [Selaginella moellendorffii]|uniref:uncharacterized protein LOC112341972 n=1 Tax=Selaginella moellendorffii TaxID=88036 RepID=UPI000D1C61BD|nr:uncharacterized protein LOC112341972 [Selaginella moellendorffii]|eukprot:XP_024518778.1 uncharacterized protein LOC112341972 [Selaginella moellendorffii]